MFQFIGLRSLLLTQTKGTILTNSQIIGYEPVGEPLPQLRKGTIIAEFPYDGKRIAGVKVTGGRLAKGDQVKVMRGEAEAARSRIKSLQHGKEEATKV